MNQQPSPPRLILIAGPIAAGKSTIAQALTRGLREAGRQVAHVELDTIADMARPTLPDWADAHRIFASVTSQWLSTDVEMVIAEGVGTRKEIEQVRDNVPAGTPILTVVLTVTFETAFARALSEPSRGISRQHRFLSEVYRRWGQELPTIDHDLRVDTDVVDPEQTIRQILSLVDWSCDH